MKNHLFYIFIIICFLTPWLSIAQSGYIEGYVILNSGDTLYGKIKDRKDAPFMSIYKKVRFKGAGLFVKRFKPNHILEYQRGSEVYESVWLNTRSKGFKTTYESIRGVGKKQFLKTVVKGNLTYYEWENLDPGSDFILEIPLFKRENENYLIRVTQGVFGLKKENLRLYFRDYPQVQEKIETKQLRTPKEIALFYNNLVEQKTFWE